MNKKPSVRAAFFIGEIRPLHEGKKFN